MPMISDYRHPLQRQFAWLAATLGNLVTESERFLLRWISTEAAQELLAKLRFVRGGRSSLGILQLNRPVGSVPLALSDGGGLLCEWIVVGAAALFPLTLTLPLFVQGPYAGRDHGVFVAHDRPAAILRRRGGMVSGCFSHN